MNDKRRCHWHNTDRHNLWLRDWHGDGRSNRQNTNIVRSVCLTYISSWAYTCFVLGHRDADSRTGETKSLGGLESER
jgi:hypothetical protein